MLLHGAGVAGELTWTFIANYLEHWDEILIPDLLGMGNSYFESSDKQPFTLEDISQSLLSLLRHLSWHEFDLVGYSLGGLVALELNHEASMALDLSSAPNFIVNSLCLIEPALFSDPSLQDAMEFRQAFIPITENIKAEPEEPSHFIDFLELVSPNRKRNPKIDQLAVQRLQARPFGFANALASVSHYADDLDEYKLDSLISVIPQGVGIIGGLSSKGLFMAQDNIRQQHKHWHIEVLPEADHSLVYVRPKQVAQLINTYLA